MDWQVFEPTKPVLVGTVFLTAFYIFLEAAAIRRACAAVTCLADQPSGWLQFSVFPHCCGSFGFWQLVLEYVLLVLLPLLISYLLVSLAAWAWRTRK